MVRTLSSLMVLVAMTLNVAATSALFADWAWAVPTVITVWLTVLTGWVARRFDPIRYSGLAVLVQFFVALYALLLIAGPESALAGIIPTPGSVTDLIAAIAQGFRDVYSSAAPAPSTPGLTVLAAVSLSLLTMLIDSLVQDLRVPKIAGVLVLLTWFIPVFVSPLSIRWWHVTALGVAFIIILLTMNVSGIRGHLWAVTAGVLALVLGLGLPLMLPPIAPQMNKPAGENQDIKVVNPFLDLRADLTDRSDEVVMTYTTEDDLLPPIRLTSVSEFDGNKWSPATFSFRRGQTPDSGIPQPSVSGDITTNRYTTHIAIRGLGGNHLPSPYAPLRTNSVGDQWIYDTESLTIVGNGVTVEGLEYDVEYTSVEPTAAQLRDAPEVDPAEFEQYLALPNNLPSDIREKAEEVTDGAESNWERAAMLQAYFREFEYSLDAPNSASGSVISQFLKDRRGYCVQFAGAMATMARTLGIPARIGVGFTGGEPNDAGEIDLSMQNSHAWPELYFEGVGWVRFEPTPGGPAGPPPPWSVEGGDESQPTEEPTEEPSSQATQEEATPESEPTPTPTEVDEPNTEESSAGTNFVVPLLVTLGVVALVVLVFLPFLVRSVLRRRRLAQPLRAQRIWEEIRATEIDFGALGLASRTVAIQGKELASRLPERATDVAALVEATEQERYAGTGQATVDIDAQGLIADLRKSLAPRAVTRLVVTLWPSSLWKK